MYLASRQTTLTTQKYIFGADKPVCRRQKSIWHVGKLLCSPKNPSGALSNQFVGLPNTFLASANYFAGSKNAFGALSNLFATLPKAFGKVTIDTMNFIFLLLYY
jgi:hypothetical protein